MTIFSPTEAKQLLLTEYPKIKSFEPVIIKRFQSSGGRDYNTFLVQTNHPALRQIIAKGAVYPTQSLIPEWQTNQFLHHRKISAPILIFPYHRPETFLLQQFITGQSVSQITNPRQLLSIIGKLAQTVGQIHSTKISRHNRHVAIFHQWLKLMKEKFAERFQVARQWLNQKEIKSSQNIFQHNIKDIIVYDKISQRLIHRDIYLDNFILSGSRVYIIDFGMAQAGDPLYDLGKFISLDLIKHPDLTKPFLKSYLKSAHLPLINREIVKFYTLHELIGTLCFSHKNDNKKYFQETLTKTRQLLAEQGQITKVLKFFPE